MKILAIDTSCDETSVAISEDTTILANVISSQIELHKKWGGVVPTIAERAHRERIDQALSEALQRAKLTLDEIDVLAVTVGPGLAIALAVGIEKIQELALRYNKPVVAVNHMIGHVYANFAQTKNGNASAKSLEYPALALLVSGKHTEMVLIQSETDWRIIGQTLDDAMGEAYDKVARMLGLGYPGGPLVAKLAEQGDPTQVDLPIPMRHSGDLNYSFSGLKTAVMHVVRSLTSNEPEKDLTKEQIANICASFQSVAIQSVTRKLKKAVEQYDIRQVLLGGGVTANTEFRRAVRSVLPDDVTLHYPNLKKLCTDNAAMIAVAAYYQSKRGEFTSSDKLDRDPSLSIVLD
jgi:N6-L-threonylcarbamoyladenine synthase